jgi:hypothetical protein
LGDQWNGEDLSIFSLDDQPLSISPATPVRPNGSTAFLVPKALSNEDRENSDESAVNPGNPKAQLSTASISSRVTEVFDLTDAAGFRATEAFVRPSPISTVDEILSYGFDLRNCTFTLRLCAHEAGSDERVTEISLPEFHFPKDKCEVEATSGKWSISTDGVDGVLTQRLRWWHLEGEQTIKVTGVRRRQAAILGEDEEESYLDQCQQNSCRVM